MTPTKTNVFAGLACPKCGDTDCLSLDLDDLEVVRCRSCEDEINISDQLAQMQLWLKLKAWIDRVSE